jgi:hypothetical protein
MNTSENVLQLSGKCIGLYSSVFFSVIRGCFLYNAALGGEICSV